MWTITYKKQNAAHTALKQGVPLEGTDHIYTVNALLWPKKVEKFVESLFIGKTLHLCCGKSTIGNLRVDLFDETAELKKDAAKTDLPDKSFDTVLCDPPYNGKLQWNHDLLVEIARLAKQRIKDHSFVISHLYNWQPKTYFGRVNVLSVFDKQPEQKGSE